MSLEVREEPDLLQGTEVEILCLVEDEDSVLTGAPALVQKVVQGNEPLDVGLTGLGDAKVLEDVLEQALEWQGSVEDEGRGGVAIQTAEQRTQKCCLPCPDLAGQQNETLALLDAVHKLRETLSVTLGEVE